MTEMDIKRPMWVRITAYGFAAVLFASATIGGLAWYRQSAMNAQALAEGARHGPRGDRIRHGRPEARGLGACALALAGEPETAELILSNAREKLVAKYAGSPARRSSRMAALELITFSSALTA
jgi:methyl-accepting chemotaxis protein